MHGSLRTSLVLIAFAVVLRPTNVLLWPVVAAWTFVDSGSVKGTVRKFASVLLQVVYCGYVFEVRSAAVPLDIS